MICSTILTVIAIIVGGGIWHQYLKVILNEKSKKSQREFELSAKISWELFLKTITEKPIIEKPITKNNDKQIKELENKNYRLSVKIKTQELVFLVNKYEAKAGEITYEQIKSLEDEIAILCKNN